MVRGPIIVAVTALHELQPAGLASLSPAEVDRAGQLKAERRRREFLCGRALLRALLQYQFGNPADSYQLETDSNGKPVCVDGPAVSIAHSGDFVVCAASAHGEIGVDIEVPQSPRNIDGIAENYFAADEVSWLATQPEDRFYMLWVLKEAWLKAKGTGITGGLDTLRCCVEPPTIEARSADGATPCLMLFTLDDADAFIGLAGLAEARGCVAIARWDPLTSQFDADSDVRLIAETDRVSRRA